MYNVRYISRWNKHKLAHDLAEAILSNEIIPALFLLPFYQCELVQAEQENKVPIIRIKRLLCKSMFEFSRDFFRDCDERK